MTNYIFIKSGKICFVLIYYPALLPSGLEIPEYILHSNKDIDPLQLNNLPVS